MANKNSKSNTGIPVNPTIVLFSGDPLVSVLNKGFITTIPGFNLGAYVSGFDIDGSAEEVDVEDLDEIENENDGVKDGSQDGEDDGSPTDPESKKLKAPTLSDIKLISNIVKYDVAGNPYSEVVIRVMNSSGVTLKGIRAKVGKAS
jgi:hypothetical protein